MGVERAGAGHRGGRMRGEQGEAGVLRGGRGSADMTFTGVSLFRAITMISITMISYTIMHLLNLKVLAKLLTKNEKLISVPTLATQLHRGRGRVILVTGGRTRY